MKKLLPILFLFTSVTIVNIVPQNRVERSSPFISGMVGTAKVSLSGSSEQNPMALAFGGSFGIPINKKSLSLYPFFLYFTI